MLFWLMLACNKSPKEVVKSPSEGHRFTKLAADRLGEPRDSVCRGFVVPEQDLNGCEMLGPYQGILEGESLSKGLDIEKAVQACVGDPKCSGITTEWYADTPFKTVQNIGGFSVDSDSYGFTFILTCTD